MMIDKVGGIGPNNYEPRKSSPIKEGHNPMRGADNVMISEEAARAADVARTAKLVKSTEDSSRAEKLKEVKEKLARGDYNNLSDDLLDQVADKIARSFLG